ncbi:uncharacterized protein [Amphiura filiformis]|uniref:uncharacterized protein n=1 Tax=Amphiura filiformis TaxID=82378 RepID=UPI003B22389D
MQRVISRLPTDRPLRLSVTTHATPMYTHHYIHASHTVHVNQILHVESSRRELNVKRDLIQQECCNSCKNAFLFSLLNPTRAAIRQCCTFYRCLSQNHLMPSYATREQVTTATQSFMFSSGKTFSIVNIHRCVYK